MKRLALFAISAALIANDEPQPKENSEFVGRYSGSSFETAMGMEILADGTWGWGLSVGALDMRARGTWERKGDLIYLTSTPKPVAPEFTFQGIAETDETAQEPPYFRVVWAKSGKEFQYSHARVTCKNTKTFYGQVDYDGYPARIDPRYDDPLPAENDPRQSCDTPESVVLEETIYDITSQPFKLAELGWTPGRTAIFAFHRNDLGLVDFTGVTGYLEDGKIKLVGAEWPLEMSKLPARDENPSPEQ